MGYSRQQNVMLQRLFKTGRSVTYTLKACPRSVKEGRISFPAKPEQRPVIKCFQGEGVTASL